MATQPDETMPTLDYEANYCIVDLSQNVHSVSFAADNKFAPVQVAAVHTLAPANFAT